jgi:hypothetical protein
MRGQSGLQARTVRTADRPASGPDSPPAHFWFEHPPAFLEEGRSKKEQKREDKKEKETPS